MAAVSFLSKLSPARALLCRNCLRATTLPAGISQKRWIGTKYLAKMKLAEAEWQEKARKISAGEVKNLFDELVDRGFVKDVIGTREHIRETMRTKRIGAYAGVDPTASSLHLGHLLPLMPLFWMYFHGYGAFTIIGTSTAKIGDPTGRTDSRPELSSKELVQNLTTIQYQLKRIWVHAEKAGQRFGYPKEWVWRRGIVNNNAWWNSLPMLEVIKRMGSSVRIGPLLSRDTVKKRLEDGSGMSFGEFCYPMMQAWDWYELFKQQGVLMQIGGSDQYGNILTGATCVKTCIENEPNVPKKHDQPIGFTVPLLTDSSGTKFGKSAGNALWLDPFKTTPFDLYGYLVRRPDDDVERLLKLFTFFPLSKISEVMEEHRLDPPKRVAQHLLAQEVLWLVHGQEVATKTQIEHRTMYGKGEPASQTESSSTMPQVPNQYMNTDGNSKLKGQTNADNAPRIDMVLPASILNQSLPRIVYAARLSSSVGDADRAVKAGGIYIGGSPGQKSSSNKGMIPEQLQFAPCRTWAIEDNKNFLIDGKILLLRKGKHNIRCIEIIDDEEWKERGLEHPGQQYTGQFRKAVERFKQMKAGELANSEGPQEETHPAQVFTRTPQKSVQKLENRIKEWKKKQGLEEDDQW